MNIARCCQLAVYYGETNILMKKKLLLEACNMCVRASAEYGDERLVIWK
jgi:hypothetical protein